jgi:A/G-specific adenine glycosylase
MDSRKYTEMNIKEQETKQGNRKLQRQLLPWYSKNRRNFPWRKTRSPYRILVSEIMLQQTQAARVAEKWKDFLTRFPTIQSIAYAPLRDVITQWEGLGYNNRALRLHQCSLAVVQLYGGRIPESLRLLTTLPGIGRYTAHALLCFAFEKRVPIVDINVRRILTRFFKKQQDSSALIGERRAWEIARILLPRRKYYEWNQALMDLGATVCRSGIPQCGRCPLVRKCQSASAITSRRDRTRLQSNEPMIGDVPRRLVRGRIVQYLRASDGTTGVTVRAVFIHLRTHYPAINLKSVHRTINALVDDGLVIIHRRTQTSIVVSLPS